MTTALDKKLEEHDQMVASPPDGGYGWIIAFLACLNMFFVLGIPISISTLLDTLEGKSTDADYYTRKEVMYRIRLS